MTDPISALFEAEDLDGLIRARADAELVAAGATGRDRRRAERQARAAGEAIDKLRQAGIETADERRAREVKEAHLRIVDAERTLTQLLRRMSQVFGLLAVKDLDAAARLDALRTLDPSDNGELRLSSENLAEPWLPLITRAYRDARQLFSKAALALPAASGTETHRLLKTVAVDLMASGANIDAFALDVVPFLAFALETGSIEFSSPGWEITDEANEILLSFAGEFSPEQDASSRLVLVSLLRLAMLIGEATAYAEQLKLAR